MPSHPIPPPRTPLVLPPEVTDDPGGLRDPRGLPAPRSSAIQVFDPGDLDPGLRSFLDSRAPATKRAHDHHWRSWQGWCLRRGAAPLPAPPRVIIEWLYEVSRPGKWGLGKIEGVVSAIAYAHRLAGYDPPPTSHTLVQAAMKSARREIGRAPKNPKAPIAADEIRAMLAQVDRTTLAGARDSAILLVGWWTAMRRSELVAIQVEQISQAPGGISIRIPRSKTDQMGEGAIVGIERKGGDLCGVAALEEWCELAKITAGPVFRGLTATGVRSTALSDQSVAIIVKAIAKLAGLDPRRFAGHSLRAGHVTEAYRQDVPEAQIMATTRHKSVAMLARYRREADPVKRGSTSRMKL